MQNSKFVKVMLIISGVLLLIIGGSYVFTPIEFFSSANQTDLSGQVNLLSEIRAAGGGLLLGGIIIIMGAFKANMTYASTMVSIVIWTGWGLARFVGMSVDGTPNEGILMATFFELVLGVMGIIAIKKYANSDATAA